LLLTRQKLHQQNVKLVRKFDGGLPKVRADCVQIEQACLNLILNAGDAMPHGGKLTVSSSLQHEPSTTIVLAFADTGTGMPAEKQKQIFEPFLTTKSHGTGLGLAIVQKIVEAHHGKIEVKSAPKKGTTFRILLPV
jgi:signal transduction histidine kinase